MTTTTVNTITATINKLTADGFSADGFYSLYDASAIATVKSATVNTTLNFQDFTDGSDIRAQWTASGYKGTLIDYMDGVSEAESIARNAEHDARGIVEHIATTTATATPTPTPVAWSTTTKKGVTTSHSTATATGLLHAPKTVVVNHARMVDVNQLKSGNFTSLREALELFKGKSLESLKLSVITDLSITDEEGNKLAPVVPWDNIRSGSHARAVARAIVGTSDLKGKKLQWSEVLALWLA